MDTAIGGIKVKIGADTSDFESGLKKTRDGLNKVGKYAAVASAAAVVGVAAIVNAQRKALDSLAKTSDALGIQQEKLQALQHIGELTGTSNEMVNKSLERMQKNLGNAARNGGASADALADLGVNVKEIVSLAPDQQMEAMARALSNVDNQSLKASISNDIFGRSGVRMLKMMEQLKSEGLDPTVNSLDKMGVSLSRIETSKVENANDAIFKAEQVVTGLANKLTVKLSPLLEAMANQFVDAAIESEGFGGAVTKAFDGAVTVVGVFADGLHGIDIIFQGLKIAAFAIGKVVNEAFRIMAKGMEGFVNLAIDGINTVIDGLNAIPLLDLEIGRIESFTSDAAIMMKGFSDQASENLEAAVEDLHNKMMEPLPSEQIKEFVANVEEAATAASEAMTNIGPSSNEGDTGTINTEDQAKTQQALDDLMLLNETKLEEVNRHELEKIALLDSLNLIEQGKRTEHEAALTEIEKNASDSRIALTKAESAAKLALTTSALDNVASLMNSSSKTAFNIGKAAALSSAGIKGVSSAISAWESGMSTGGPWAPAVAAAYAGASILKTGTMMQQISSQSFGSPSSPVSISGGIPSVNTQGGGQQQSNNVSIDIVGSENATFSRDSVIGLIGQINSAVSDGVSLNTGS